MVNYATKYKGDRLPIERERKSKRKLMNEGKSPGIEKEKEEKENKKRKKN